MGPEFVLIASVVLGVILVPSLITVRAPSHYPGEEELSPTSPVPGSQPAE